METPGPLVHRTGVDMDTVCAVTMKIGYPDPCRRSRKSLTLKSVGDLVPVLQFYLHLTYMTDRESEDEYRPLLR